MHNEPAAGSIPANRNFRMPAYTISSDAHAGANPRDRAFFQNPYAFYRDARAGSPSFFWEDYGHWCFARLRARSAPCSATSASAGRSCMSQRREQLGLPEPKPHTRRLRPDREIFAARPGAAGPHAAEHAGQPRLRVAPGRAAEAAHRSLPANSLIDGFVGRSCSGSASRPRFRRAAADHHHRGDARSSRASWWSGEMLDWFPYCMVATCMHGRTRETEDQANQGRGGILGHFIPRGRQGRATPKSGGDDLMTLLLSVNQGWR